jgi:hypothetical protein
MSVDVQLLFAGALAWLAVLGHLPQAAGRLDRIVVRTEPDCSSLPTRHRIKPTLLVGEPLDQHIEEQPDLGA